LRQVQSEMRAHKDHGNSDVAAAEESRAACTKKMIEIRLGVPASFIVACRQAAGACQTPEL
jgi:hypothetical protein